jgi:hypothetical protein
MLTINDKHGVATIENMNFYCRVLGDTSTGLIMDVCRNQKHAKTATIELTLDQAIELQLALASQIEYTVREQREQRENAGKKKAA